MAPRRPGDSSTESRVALRVSSGTMGTLMAASRTPIPHAPFGRVDMTGKPA